MSRKIVLELKSELRHGLQQRALGQDGDTVLSAALGLLERSVRMTHRRLAVQRLNHAVTLGARVPEEHWRYCREVAAASKDSALHALISASERIAEPQHPETPQGMLHG